MNHFVWHGWLTTGWENSFCRELPSLRQSWLQNTPPCLVESDTSFCRLISMRAWHERRLPSPKHSVARSEPLETKWAHWGFAQIQCKAPSAMHVKFGRLPLSRLLRHLGQMQTVILSCLFPLRSDYTVRGTRTQISCQLKLPYVKRADCLIKMKKLGRSVIRCCSNKVLGLHFVVLLAMGRYEISMDSFYC